MGYQKNDLRRAQQKLRYGVDNETADKICCESGPNRKFVEYKGYAFDEPRNVIEKIKAHEGKEITFYDSVTGKPVFYAPRGRNLQEFIDESKKNGYLSFRE